MARRSGFRPRGRVGQRRETIWSALITQEVAIAGGDVATLMSFAGAGINALRPYTIVRTRGLLRIRSDQQAADEFQQVSFGHCVVSDQAIAIGVTAVPTPDTDMDSDLWYVFEQLWSQFDFISGVGFSSSGGNEIRYDSKAMRKVEEGETDISVAESSSTSSGLVLTHSFRQLLKLH